LDYQIHFQASSNVLLPMNAYGVYIMESMPQFGRLWASTLTRIWQKRANPADFVWLARFRLLTLYTLFKSFLILAAGIIGMRLNNLLAYPAHEFSILLWVGITLGLSAAILLLISGLVLASQPGSRSIGLLILFASDVCILLAVMYACILNNLFLLLVILILTTCTTPILVERISRYAKRFLKSSSELEDLKNELDMLLLQHSQHSQRLANAIEYERMSLKREIHDGLMQDLSALSLQISVLIMHKSEEGALQLNASDVAKLETALRRAVAEARHVMNDLYTQQPVVEKQMK
jgi:signal transduction histidine kinase